MIFDTHAHYDDEDFREDQDRLLTSFAANGIEKVVNVSASIESVDRSLELTEKYPYIYASVGVHPNETAPLNEEHIVRFREICKHEKVVAIGEIGLDYYWDEPDHETQKKWFIRQIELAREVNLPLIIHSRDAAKDTMDIMKEHASDLGGVIHCFSYSAEMAKEYVEMGYYIGIGGVVTFKNAKKLKEVVEAIPLERIVLETDSPYLTPEPYRGKRNCSLYLPYVADAIASLKGITVNEVERVTYQNALDLYRL